MKKQFMHVALIACGAALWACNGWPDANDAKQAEQKPEKYPTYAAASAEESATIVFGDRRYTVTPALVDLHDAQLQPVGTAGTVSLYAPKGEQAPYSALYTPVSGTVWRRVLPIE